MQRDPPRPSGEVHNNTLEETGQPTLIHVTRYEAGRQVENWTAKR